jgi:hypothetical protein
MHFQYILIFLLLIPDSNKILNYKIQMLTTLEFYKYIPDNLYGILYTHYNGKLNI